MCWIDIFVKPFVCLSNTVDQKTQDEYIKLTQAQRTKELDTVSELTADPLTTSFQQSDFTSTIDLEAHSQVDHFDTENHEWSSISPDAGPSSEPTASPPSAYRTVSEKILGQHAEEKANAEDFDKLKSSLEGSTQGVNDGVLNSHDLNSSETYSPTEHSDKDEIDQSRNNKLSVHHMDNSVSTLVSFEPQDNHDVGEGKKVLFCRSVMVIYKVDRLHM